MNENKFGLTDWDDYEFPKKGTNTNQTRGTQQFIRLQNGDNEMRIVTKPFFYMQHKYKADGEKGFGKSVKCSAYHGSCPLCDMKTDDGKPKFKATPRWYVGVIDRRTGTYKILDMSPSIFEKVQKLSRNERWGDPSGYDINIEKDPNASSPANYYNVMPLGRAPLSEEDMVIKKGVDPDDLRRRCTPPTPAQVTGLLEKFGAEKSVPPAAVASEEDSSDSEEEEHFFPAAGV